ncbi:MAG TPA: STAS domain-containing protein [Acidimicrobiales bacterium]
MAATEESPATLVLGLRGTISRSEVADLCEQVRRLLEGSAARHLVCDVGDMITRDVGALDALARLALTVRRLGREVWLRGACPELLTLVALAGLEDVLPAEPGPCDPPGGEPGEPPGDQAAGPPAGPSP